MKRLALGTGILLLSLVLAACVRKVTRPSGTSVTPVSSSPSSVRTALPYTPVPFEVLEPYPTPEGTDFRNGVFPAQELPAGVTPVVPTTDRLARASGGYPYYLVQQKQIGHYVVRVWEGARTGLGIFTIAVEEAVLVRLEAERVEVRHAGQDITGEGNPDVVVRLVLGAGSYISLATHVYDLGPRLTEVLDTPSVATDSYYGISCPEAGVFSDLGGDGVPEFITCDDAPRLGFYGEANINPYAEHRRLVVPAVMEYEAGRGYVPAGPRFAQVYASNIADYTREAEEDANREATEYSGISPTALVALAFNYLYSGQPDKAWFEIERLHKGPDKVLIWSEILRQARESSLFQAHGVFPNVPVPDYYTLRLVPVWESSPDCLSSAGTARPTCEPEDWLADRLFSRFYLPVCLLKRGQDLGEEGVALRTLAWLDYELARAGLKDWGEGLQAPTTDCSDRCRLDLAGRADGGEDTLVGFIELDATGDFPGEVVRLDRQGNEVLRMRLRGDLSWEEVAR